MALLAEVVVEEWLNRNGYFTIRGIRLGNDEVDLLAVKVGATGVAERRHIEVQISSNPVGYLVKKNATRLTEDQLVDATREWVNKKFLNERKSSLFNNLAPGQWTKELVFCKLRESETQCRVLESFGVNLIKLNTILDELKTASTMIRKAGGSDLLELISLSACDD